MVMETDTIVLDERDLDTLIIIRHYLYEKLSESDVLQKVIVDSLLDRLEEIVTVQVLEDESSFTVGIRGPVRDYEYINHKRKLVNEYIDPKRRGIE